MIGDLAREQILGQIRVRQIGVARKSGQRTGYVVVVKGDKFERGRLWDRGRQCRQTIAVQVQNLNLVVFKKVPRHTSTEDILTLSTFTCKPRRFKINREKAV